MSFKVRAWRYALVPLLLGSYAASGQEQTTRRSRSDMEQFLLKANVTHRTTLKRGVTNSERATLSDGAYEHDAHIQCINEEKSSFTSKHGTELNFKDSYKFNVAAYKLDKILDLNMIPVSVERKVGGTTSAVTWWVDDTMMNEEERHKKNLEPPDKEDWARQMYVVRVFDQLISNTDRNLGNLVIDKKWRMWMIDHTRAFRLQARLLNEKNLVKCDRQLLANLRKLDEENLNQGLRPFLTKTEIKAIMARRDLIVEFFETQIAKKGAGAVLYDLLPRE